MPAAVYLHLRVGTWVAVHPNNLARLNIMRDSLKSKEDKDSNKRTSSEHLKDGGFVLASRVVAQSAQFLIFLVAVQFLSQSEFGYFALATAICSLFIAAARAGWGQYILAGHVREENTGFVYSLALIWGLFLSAVGIAIGLFFAWWMETPTLGFVIALISLTVTPTCFAGVNESTMLRRGQVRIATVIWMVAEICGLVVGVSTLFLGWKEYGLVAARFAATAITTLLNISFLKATPSLRGNREIFTKSIMFYKDMLGTVVLSFLGSNLGLFLIGFMFGGAAAGIYRAAARFSGAITEFVWEPSSILAWKNIPMTEEELSKNKDARTCVRDRYLNFLQIFAFIVCPVMLGAASLGPEIATLLLGEEWKDTGPIFSALIIAGMFYMLYWVGNVVFASLDRTQDILQLQLAAVAILLLSIASLGWVSPLTAALMHLPQALIVLWLAVRKISLLLGINMRDLVKQVLPQLVCAFGMMAGVLLFKSLLKEHGLENIYVILLSVFSGVVMYLMAAHFVCRKLMLEIFSILMNFKNNRPSDTI